MRTLLLASLLTVPGLSPAPAATLSVPPPATCDAPIPFATYPSRGMRGTKVGHQAADPEATLRSALHLCVLPARGGRAVRSPTYRG